LSESCNNFQPLLAALGDQRVVHRDLGCTFLLLRGIGGGFKLRAQGALNRSRRDPANIA